MRVCVVVPIRACPSLCIGEALACHGIVPLDRVQTVATQIHHSVLQKLPS